MCACVSDVRRRRQVKYEGHVMRISNIKNQRANTTEKCFHSINTEFFAFEDSLNGGTEEGRYMCSMKSNVVFASVRRNWGPSRDGFIVCEAPPFFQDSAIDLSKY